MGRSQLAGAFDPDFTSIPSTSVFLFLYILCLGLAGCRASYQTPLPPIIARGTARQFGSFAPLELPQFIAIADSSATFSPSFLFPVHPVIGRNRGGHYLSMKDGYGATAHTATTL